jgi:hypothetical protein
MNIGLSELFIVLVSLVLLLGVPAVVILAAILLFRRLHELEDRISKLEDRHNSSAKLPGKPI